MSNIWLGIPICCWKCSNLEEFENPNGDHWGCLKGCIFPTKKKTCKRRNITTN